MNNATSLANALNEYVDAFDNFLSEMKDFGSKNPEFYQPKQSPEIADIFERCKKATGDLHAISIATKNAVEKYNTSPMVLRANERFQKLTQHLLEVAKQGAH